MGYFSNGTEGDQYESKYCEKCVHYENCVVWEAHLLYSYELCNEKDNPGKEMLDMLIPITDDGLFNKKCTMFHKKRE